MYLGEKRLKEYTILPQNPTLHTSLDHFCHSIHRCELVTSQNYPAKKKSLSFLAWFKKAGIFQKLLSRVNGSTFQSCHQV